MRYEELDISKVKTQSAFGRVNLVRIDSLRTPGGKEEPFSQEGFERLVALIIQARESGRPVTARTCSASCAMRAHSAAPRAHCQTIA